MAESKPSLMFKNDGSFLEQFLRMQNAGSEGEASKENVAEVDSSNSPSKAESEPVYNAETQNAEEVDAEQQPQPAESDNDSATDKLELEDKPQVQKSGPFAKFGSKAPFSASVKRPAASADSSKRKKKKDDTPEVDNPAWQAYLKEVEKYRNASCAEEREHRPLVK